MYDIDPEIFIAIEKDLFAIEEAIKMLSEKIEYVGEAIERLNGNCTDSE